MEEIYLSQETEKIENVEIQLEVEKPRESKPQISEIFNLRKRDRKVFKMNDGTEQAVFYSKPVHVFNEDAKTFVDVDKTLVEDAEH